MLFFQPPAFMGSALVGTFNNYFYQIEVTKPYDNEQEVESVWIPPT